MPKLFLEGQLTPPLPPEIMVEILDHLNRYDLRSVILVNSAMAALARPLCYKHGRFDIHDIAFPLAPHSFPFFQTFDPKLDLSRQRQQSILAGMRSLTLTPHNTEDCHCCRSFSWRNTLPPINVLRITLPHLMPWREDLQRIMHLQRTSDQYTHPCAHAGECTCKCTKGLSGCRWASEVLAVAQDTRPIQKLVLREVVVAPKGNAAPQDPYNEVVKPFETARNCVQVLTGNSPIIGRLNCSAGCSRLPRIFVPQRAESLTVIFWAGYTRTGVWVPPCKDWHHYSPLHDPKLRSSHDCKFQRTIWGALAWSLTYSQLKHLTVVNAVAVPPPRTSLPKHVANLAAGIATDDAVREAFLTEYADLMETRPAPYTTTEAATVRFLSFEDWLEEADWQDVFSPAEISGHFTRLAAGKPMSEQGYVRLAEALGLAPRPEIVDESIMYLDLSSGPVAV